MKVMSCFCERSNVLYKYKKHKELYFKCRAYCANCNDSHLDTSQDGQRSAAKDGVLQDSGDVLVPGLHQADRLAEGEGQGARPVMILQVVADWEISVNRNAVL